MPFRSLLNYLITYTCPMPLGTRIREVTLYYQNIKFNINFAACDLKCTPHILNTRLILNLFVHRFPLQQPLLSHELHIYGFNFCI